MRCAGRTSLLTLLSPLLGPCQPPLLGIHKATVKVIGFLPPQRAFSPLPITHRGQFNKSSQTQGVILGTRCIACVDGTRAGWLEEGGGGGLGAHRAESSEARPWGGSGRASFLLPLIIY